MVQRQIFTAQRQIRAINAGNRKLILHTGKDEILTNLTVRRFIAESRGNLAQFMLLMRSQGYKREDITRALEMCVEKSYTHKTGMEGSKTEKKGLAFQGRAFEILPPDRLKEKWPEVDYDYLRFFAEKCRWDPKTIEREFAGRSGC
ncbi:MAG: hypothetical protein NT157_02070 [Candidatus Micrarchaeota archaeon]|nr:hypothetical protein [Candidatus Micrarchaeota archaeon]